MKKFLTILLLVLACAARAQTPADPRSIAMTGIPIEGPIDSLDVSLREHGFTAWGQSDDGEDYYYRGMFYGFRAKLMVTVEPQTRLVQSAYVTIGPYSTQKMLDKNLNYFLYKLEHDNGELTRRDGSWFYIDDYGSIKVSVVTLDNGAHEIGVLYLNTAPYYKDALTRGLHGNVQEVVTENALAEEQFLHFHNNGQVENLDLVERHYDRYGYLLTARMKEKEGYSTVHYTYDDSRNLVRRTLVNEQAGISYTNEYTYNDLGEPLTEQQKVFDKNKECLMTINMRYDYLTRDDNGNWTSNSLTFTYWEKGTNPRQSTVLQKRTLTYWE